jgi:drug/metabolite transporter (DMT)-like permease
MSPGRGIALKLISVAIFTAMSALIKSVAGDIPPGEAVFFRSLFAIPVILVWLMLRGEVKGGFATKNPLGHVWRGLVGTAAMGCGFAGLGLLPLPEVTAIGYAAPLLTVIFGAMFLNEQVGVFRLSTVALGMVGVLIVLSPRLSAFGGAVDDTMALGAIVVLTGATFASLAQVFVRRLVQTEQTSAIVFWFSVTSCTVSLLTIPFGWAVPTASEAVRLVLAGLLGGTGQVFLTSSYRHADASVIAPFEYASMLLALIVGYKLFDEVPSPIMLVGASIVVLAGVLIILRERRLGIERSRQRRAMTP